jgi:putative membrane protein
MIAAVVIISIIGGVSASFLIPLSLIDGLMFGSIGMAAPLLIAEFAVSPLFKENLIFNPRRFTIMTYVSSIVFSAVLPLFSVFARVTHLGNPIRGAFVVSAGLTAGLRLLSLRSLVDDGIPRVYLAALLPPIASLFAMAVISGMDLLMTLLSISAIIVYLAGVEALLLIIRRWEGEVDLLPLFRAFVLAWAENLSEPLENEISLLGEKRDLTVDGLYIRGDKGNHVGALIIPYIHPGPFRNVGGSALPEVLAKKIGKALGCEALIAHGVSTHETDLTDGRYNLIIAERVIGDVPKSPLTFQISPMVWSEEGVAKASCQIFGRAALITLTLSPLSYDDLPKKIEVEIEKIAEKKGLRAMVVDSHNSIDLEGGPMDYEEKDVLIAAKKAIEAASSEPKYLFQAASARFIPTEWDTDDGMGPGGISALVLSLSGRGCYAYLVVDGNNMTTGLRDKLVSTVLDMELDGVEVMTSDTHIVNAIGATERGYYPIGDRMNKDKLVDYVVEVLEEALGRLEPGAALSSRTVVEDLTVLGQKGLSTLYYILESGFNLFWRAGLALGTSCFLVSLALAWLF